MRVCLSCHKNLGCEERHPTVMLHCGEVCGVCSGGATAHDCNSPVAREIDSYNRAVRTFSLRMRAKFLANLRDKGGWQEIGYDYALKRLLHEAGELSTPLMTFVKSQDTLSSIVDEAADVANFAMFIGSRAQQEFAREESIRKHTDETLARLEAEKNKGVEAK